MSVNNSVEPLQVGWHQGYADGVVDGRCRFAESIRTIHYEIDGWCAECDQLWPCRTEQFAALQYPRRKEQF